MKKLIITVASLLIMVEHMVAGAGVVVVSDPGQSPSGGLITTWDIVPFLKVALTASNVSASVFFTVNQRSSGSQLDIDLFAGSMSNKFTGGPTVIGPFPVQSGQTNNIVVSARVNGIKATNSSPASVALDLTAVSNSTPGIIVQGSFPIQGTTYLVDTNSEEVVKGKFTSISWTYISDEQGDYYLLIIGAVADQLRTYSLEHSVDMVSWENWLEGMEPGYNGNFQIADFIDPTNFPNKGFFRLKSQ